MGKCSDSFLFLLFLPEMSNFLIFTRQQDIRRISLEVEYYADVVVAGSLKNAIAIDVDVVEGNFFIYILSSVIITGDINAFKSFL